MQPESSLLDDCLFIVAIYSQKHKGDGPQRRALAPPTDLPMTSVLHEGVSKSTHGYSLIDWETS